MSYFCGSPLHLSTVRHLNAQERDAKRWRALGADLPPLGSPLRKDVLKRLRLDEGSSDEQLYAAALEMFDLIDHAKQDQAPQLLGYRRVGVALSQVAKKILAAGEARDLGEAQRIALRRDPSLGRR